MVNALLKNSSVFKNCAGLLCVFLEKNEEKPASLSPARKGKAGIGCQCGPHLLSSVACTACPLTPVPAAGTGTWLSPRGCTLGCEPRAEPLVARGPHLPRGPGTFGPLKFPPRAGAWGLQATSERYQALHPTGSQGQGGWPASLSLGVFHLPSHYNLKNQNVVARPKSLGFNSRANDCFRGRGEGEELCTPVLGHRHTGPRKPHGLQLSPAGVIDSTRGGGHCVVF